MKSDPLLQGTSTYKLNKRVYDVHQGEPYFKLIKFADLVQMNKYERKEAEQAAAASHSDDINYDLVDLMDQPVELNENNQFLNIIDSNQRIDFDPLKTAVKEYIVTPRGMVGSLRTRWKGDIQIGRQHIQDDGTTPNDIVLATDDLAVSRVHCRIIYQDGFLEKTKGTSNKRMIPKLFFEFFKIFSDRHLSKNPKIKYLPTEIRMIILSYLRKPRNFFI